MKVKFISFISLILLFQHSFAQNTPESIADKFFDVYKKEGSNKALEYLFLTNKYSEDSRAAIDNLKDKLHQIIVADGQFLGQELLSKKTAGPNLVLLTYLVKHDREPLTFRIVFYRPNDKWQVQNFKFDDKMDDELIEASKGITPCTQNTPKNAPQ